MVREAGLLHIGINLLSESPVMAGVGTFSRNLLLNLAALDTENRYTVLLDHRTMPCYFFEREGFHFAPFHVPVGSNVWRRVWEQLIPPLVARRLGLDLIHSIANVSLVAAPVKTVVTIHDLTLYTMPRRFGRLKHIYLRLLVPYTARRAGAIITDSASTRADIARYCRVRPDRITVVHLGVSEDFRPVDDTIVHSIARRYGVPEHYMLFVGKLEPGKNIVRLIEAFARLGDAAREYVLVIVGAKGWLYDEVFRRVEDLGLEKRVLFLGYVPLVDLPALYSGADLFVFPSLYEGFGLPPLEAMACGTPTVVSNVSSLPEVVGDAAELIDDPCDVDQIADAMRRVLSDPDRKADLSARGLEHAARFTWQKTAQRTMQVYRKVCSECCV